MLVVDASIAATASLAADGFSELGGQLWEVSVTSRELESERVRARSGIEIVSPAEGTGVFAVRATFVLADGTTMKGYCIPSPPGDNVLGYLVPTICH